MYIRSDGELYPFCGNDKEGREKKEGPSRKKLLLSLHQWPSSSQESFKCINTFLIYLFILSIPIMIPYRKSQNYIYLFPLNPCFSVNATVGIVAVVFQRLARQPLRLHSIASRSCFFFRHC